MRQPSASDVDARNAGVTPDPPQEIRRSERTASDVNPGAFTNDTKNAGGPIMNVISSRSMISSAADGIPLGHRHHPQARHPRSTPLSRPEMWAMRRRQQDGVVGAEPVHLGHGPGLVQQRPVGVQRHLGSAGRPRRAQRDGDRRGVDGRRRGADRARRSGARSRCGRTPSARAGSIIAATSAAPARWWIGAATAPSRQQARNSEMAGHPLASCHETVDPASTPSDARPPAISEISCSNGVVPSSATSSDSSRPRSTRLRPAVVQGVA